MFNEIVVNSLSMGSTLYTFTIEHESQVFEIVTTREIARGFISDDMSIMRIEQY